MRWSEIDQQDCSIAQALSIVGDRWTMMVLREAFMRVRRFEDFQTYTGAPRPVLADRLKRLVEEGVLERRRYSERPDRYEYRLTEQGLDLWPVMVSLLRWGDRWLTDKKGPPVELRHKGCGHVMHPELACPDCGEWLEARDIDATARRPTAVRRAG
ncbi:MAG TPA: helix-turn-helix domain-containing protein [Acidimicrobiia bacterium]|nr:helix-turn-helix domain-containing protein [Acidimicrobiia bacterium]